MKEVSCKVIAQVLREAERRTLPAGALTAGTDYSLAQLKNPKERIHWDEFVQIMANARKIWSEEQLIEIGGRIARSPIMLAFNIVARVLFTAKDFYFFVNKSGGGPGNLLFPCVRPS